MDARVAGGIVTGYRSQVTEWKTEIPETEKQEDKEIFNRDEQDRQD
jgi:hypothetical protein